MKRKRQHKALWVVWTACLLYLCSCQKVLTSNLWVVYYCKHHIGQLKISFGQLLILEFWNFSKEPRNCAQHLVMSVHHIQKHLSFLSGVLGWSEQYNIMVKNKNLVVRFSNNVNSTNGFNLSRSLLYHVRSRESNTLSSWSCCSYWD